MERVEFEQWTVCLRPSLMEQAQRLLPREEAEDIVQDTLCRLWLLRHRLYAYRSRDALARTVLRHLALNRLRDTRHTAALLDTRAEVPDLADVTDDTDERLAAVLSLVDRLPDRQQTILRMKHIDGLEVPDIARLTGCSPEAVRMNLSRARRQIRDQFLTRQKP